MGLFAALMRAQRRATGADSPFEYKRVAGIRNLQRYEAGGWELVESSPVMHKGNSVTTLYLMRRLRAPKAA